MKRVLAYLLPLIFVLASCGTASQYAQQRYADGIYERFEPAPEPVQIYSREDFEQMAAHDIARDRAGQFFRFLPGTRHRTRPVLALVQQLVVG